MIGLVKFTLLQTGLQINEIIIPLSDPYLSNLLYSTMLAAAAATTRRCVMMVMRFLFFVVVPEEMILLDTKKAAGLFEKFDVPISGYVVNRVVPHELLDQEIPAYLRNRIEMQDHYLGQIQEMFGGLVTAFVPELERDVTGLEMIERLAKIMFAGEKAEVQP